MLSLSPEICKRIVQNSYYWQDVLALCLTCKAFQKDAEVKLYSQLQFTDPRRAVLACNTLLDNERLALHVRGFWFNQQNDRQRPTNLGREFWSLIQKALVAMSNLEVLVLCDRSFANGWVLEHSGIQFKLKEAKLWFVWNAALTAFLDTQDTLQTLHFVDSLDVINHQVTPGALPCLRIFDGTLMVTMQLLSCPLVHLQVIVDADSNPAIVLLLQQLGHLRKTITSLNLLDVPEEWSTRFLGTISLTLPDLKHIGIVPYPIVSRHEFFKHLMRMHSLKSIEVDIGKWQPAPMIPGGQRALASELQTYCSSIQLVTFWMGNSRVRWSYSTSTGQWQHKVDPQIYPQYSNTWCQY